jgi:hypothetical protein
LNAKLGTLDITIKANTAEKDILKGPQAFENSCQERQRRKHVVETLNCDQGIVKQGIKETATPNH